jgi:hypothetical protein
MKKKWYSTLPWIGLLSGVLVIILLALAIVFKPSGNIENAVNRKIAYDKLKQVRIKSKEFFNSRSFKDYLDKTLDCSVINTKWLISDNGVIIYASGMMAPSTPLNTSIYSSIDDQSLGLINAVDGNIDTLQKELMYAAAAIRSEGEHNDINGHIVMPLKTSSNELVGFIGVAYTLDDSAQPVQIYVIDIALIISFLMYWLSFPLWVYYDCREKDNKYILWTLFVFIGNLPAYIAYLITKK